jgi:hypothetical protein
MIFDRGFVTCPECSSAIQISQSVFRVDRCPHCSAELQVSTLYARMVALSGCLLGCSLAWEVGSFGPRSCFFGIPWLFFPLCIPFTFLVLSVLFRIAPFVVRPTLILRSPRNQHTTLNLSAAPKAARTSQEVIMAIRSKADIWIAHVGQWCAADRVRRISSHEVA